LLSGSLNRSKDHRFFGFGTAIFKTFPELKDNNPIAAICAAFNQLVFLIVIVAVLFFEISLYYGKRLGFKFVTFVEGPAPNGFGEI
jgi:hypothetical protein